MKKIYMSFQVKKFMENDYFYCDNIDMKSTPEGLNKFFNVKIIAKNSPIKRSHKIKSVPFKFFKFNILCF